MGMVPVVIGAVASFLLRGQGIGFWFAVLATIAAFWSFGIMHNFAYRASHERLERTRKDPKEAWQELMLKKPGELVQSQKLGITPTDAQAAPNWATMVNMVAAAACVGALVWGLVITFSIS